MRKPDQTGREKVCSDNAVSKGIMLKVRKGLWSPEEDQKLIDYMLKNGQGCWTDIARNAGLQRCGKSCRLRWINYLRPDLKRGSFSPEEQDMILHLHSILGNRYVDICIYDRSLINNIINLCFFVQIIQVVTNSCTSSRKDR